MVKIQSLADKTRHIVSVVEEHSVFGKVEIDDPNSLMRSDSGAFCQVAALVGQPSAEILQLVTESKNAFYPSFQ